VNFCPNPPAAMVVTFGRANSLFTADLILARRRAHPLQLTGTRGFDGMNHLAAMEPRHYAGRRLPGQRLELQLQLARVVDVWALPVELPGGLARLAGFESVAEVCPVGHLAAGRPRIGRLVDRIRLDRERQRHEGPRLTLVRLLPRQGWRCGYLRTSA
jgi:hypothetical protein